MDRVIDINVRGVFATTQAALKHMKDGGLEVACFDHCCDFSLRQLQSNFGQGYWALRSLIVC